MNEKCDDCRQLIYNCTCGKNDHKTSYNSMLVTQSFKPGGEDYEEILLRNHKEAISRTSLAKPSRLISPTIENIASLHPDSIEYKLIVLSEISFELSNAIRLKYMESIAWRIVRGRILERDHHHCTECYQPHDILQAHHITYERLFNESDGDLRTLCVECHEKIHEVLSSDKMLKGLQRKWSFKHDSRY